MSIPKEYIPAVDAGIQEALTNGVLAGYPMVDVRVTLTFGSYHDVDSSEMAFKIAGSMAVKKAAKQASPVLLEPIMAVEVVTPEDYMGDVIGDLSSRRGKVEGMEQRGTSQVVRAQVPLSDMFGYATDLRSRTQGRATYTMQFNAYQEVPDSIAREIVARARGRVATDRRPNRHSESQQTPAATRGQPQHETRRGPRGPAREKEAGARAMAKQKFERNEAPRQHRHDGAHRPRQDDAHRGDHQGPARAQPERRPSRPSTRSTRRRRRRSGASPSRSPTSSTRPTSATTRTSTCPATPTTSRT